MAFNLEKLKEVARPRSQASIEKERLNIENKEWVLRSQEIAISIHYYLHENGISQSELAKRMGVSAPYVAKILRGNENLTLDTICKLERALCKQLINVYKPYECNLTIMPIPEIDNVNCETGFCVTMQQKQSFVFYNSKISRA